MEGSRFLNNRNNNSYGFMNNYGTLNPADYKYLDLPDYSAPSITEGMSLGTELPSTGIGSNYDQIKAPNSSNSGNRFGFNKETFSALGTAMQGLGALGSAYIGYKNYQQGKKQFGFEKAAFNRNTANQSALINRQIDASANIAAIMSTPPDATEAERAAIRERFMNAASQRHVDGSPVR
jgi:hypothetical protein